ncbi:MAG TPA: carbonic anhydrase [Nannocystis sp.]
MRRLLAGNERYKNGTRSVAALASQLQRDALVAGQSPFAIVLSCSDSRAPAEILFDQGVGDLFVIRVAGNIVAPSGIGSAEFAAATFGTRLVVVMGHTSCGAVTATLQVLRGEGTVASDNIRDIVDRIRPTAQTVLEVGKDRSPEQQLTDAIRANVRNAVDHLRHGSRILEDMVNSGQLVIVGAVYDIATGHVDFFDAPAGLGEALQAR